MTQHELFEKTFSALHASPDTILEVKRTMQNEKKTRRILGRGAVIAIAAALTLSVAVAAGVVLIRADVSPADKVDDTTYHAFTDDMDASTPTVEGNSGELITLPDMERIPGDRDTVQRLVGDYLSKLDAELTIGSTTITLETFLVDESGCGILTYTVDDPAQLTPEFFKKLEKQYRPKQVIIEFNGMWSFEPLYREGLPANWILYQIMCLVDATTFEPYLRNMGQLMMEKILNADMIIFNRCNEELRKALRGRNLRMVNRRADIYLENTDGTSEDYVTEDMAPFDLSGGHLDVPDNDYGIWYVDMMDNPQRYDGITVRYKALMCHSKKFPGIHCPGRFAMVCCNNDMQFLALVCKGEGLEKFKNRQWVEIEATVKKEQCQAYDGEGPVLYVTGVKPCQKPDPENVSF